MASRSSWWWACLCVLWLRDVSVASPRYVLQSPAGSFSDAQKNCSPGVLATLATQRELDHVLALISVKKNLTFWVGLKKNNTECVVPTLPLRGFRWTETGLQNSEGIEWAEEPAETCTEIRCAALTSQSDGSRRTRWGLISVTCKNQYRYICKLEDGQDGRSPETSTPEPDLQSPEPSSSSGPCAEGFQREGSYRCVDQTTPPPTDGSLAAILVPALAALAALVVLVVLVLVTVKCCLVRRAKRRAARRAQKMAMKSKHEKTSKETANEKEAT
ncbi:C-type lectin domain family 14 member A [Mugil cephalus]|uniref:C-type lectin domain family 14 member A n=1 Tax=Mugil cephalus TaxID=48193 RepID=UPI001FB5EB57|nr:C-type lectin domain family 14 member A [Mugil cephalus]